MKTVRTYPNELAAQAAADFLTEEGVETRILGANAAAVMPYLGPLSEVELVVHDRDHERADKLLGELERSRRESTHCIHCGYDLTGLPEHHTCPECGVPYGVHPD